MITVTKRRTWRGSSVLTSEPRRVTGQDCSSQTRGRLAAVLAWTLLGVGAVAGCSTSDHEVNTFLHEWEASVSATEYRVQPPDSLEISSAQATEIDGEDQIIRQDGKVSLRLVGEVEVAGLTPTEIARKIESLLRKYYVDPKVSVRVSSKDSKRFYVFGQVSRPGAYHYTGRDSLLFVLSQTQPNMIAWKSQVKVIHPSHDAEKRQVMTVDVDRIMEQGKLDQNVLLQEGDIVYVPATPLGWVGLRIQEALWPVTPMLSAVQAPATISSGIDTAGHEDAYRNTTYYNHD